MLHEPAPQSPQEDKSSGAKARLGLWLFAAYCIVYAGFVAVNALSPRTMEARGIFGINLATTFGFGLIILAIVLGLAYNALCTRMENKADATGEDRA